MTTSMMEEAPYQVTITYETLCKYTDNYHVFVSAYLFSTCQGGQEALVFLLLCCCHDDKVLFVVKCTRRWL